jgi:hypothetical protein
MKRIKPVVQSLTWNYSYWLMVKDKRKYTALLIDESPEA